ncbi:sulfite exporter TauE/SafE family protein [Paenibacillus sp. N1-5-1-14]|uniref:sulfite exporter TauE/SafE family protein n=1 Tax=Paenibacillus radicibacter TaxID=2972488 RepID=UPI00215989A2|nr:sulfite exporter TauE/SafE family protein [Paenibacillus radicibacter]MCR8645488.1 sulfite exporter TauE/SafE family protein [Paenibacillus radicibacter]
MILVLGILIVLVAGFIQGLTSFGFALISMPILAKIIPIQEAVPIIVILSICANVVILINCMRHVDMKKIWILVVSSILAAPLGTYLLVYLSANILKISTGVLIIMFACILLLGKSFPIRDAKVAFIPVGIISGLLNSSISMSGPPVALFLSNQNTSKDVFRANLTAYAIILNMITLVTYMYSGLLTTEVLSYTAWLIPSMFVGVLLGIKAIKKLDDRLFKKIALWLIIISGIWTIISSI